MCCQHGAPCVLGNVPSVAGAVKKDDGATHFRRACLRFNSLALTIAVVALLPGLLTSNAARILWNARTPLVELMPFAARRGVARTRLCLRCCAVWRLRARPRACTFAAAARHGARAPAGPGPEGATMLVAFPRLALRCLADCRAGTRTRPCARMCTASATRRTCAPGIPVAPAAARHVAGLALGFRLAAYRRVLMLSIPCCFSLTRPRPRSAAARL